MSRSFQIMERTLGQGCREIRVEGELDMTTAGELREMLARTVAECQRMAICLDGCEFIDSTGIAVIVQAHRQLAEAGGHLAAYGARDQVLRTLSITGLTSKGMVVETLEEAVSIDSSAADGVRDGWPAG